MKLRDLKGKFGTRFCFKDDLVSMEDIGKDIVIVFFIAEDPLNNEKITMIQENMKGGFISFDDESSIWDDEVIVFNS